VKTKISAWLIALFLAGVSAGRAQTYLDTIVLGNPASELTHSFSGPNTTVITNAAVSPAATARRGLTNNPATVYGGSLTFQLAVDPVWRTYVTLKLWGGDDYSKVYQQDSDMGRLYLYVPASNYVAGATNFYQVGYRHEGDYAPLNTAAYKAPLPGRFFYTTTLLPLWMTRGRTNLTLTIQPGGRIFDLGAGGPPTGSYQFNMITNSRGIYQAYTHIDPVLNPVGEAQGSPPATVVRPSPTVATLSPGGTFYNGINGYLGGRLSADVTSFTTTDVMQLAKAYSLANFSATYANAATVAQIVAAIDYFATNYFANASTAVSANGSEGWGGRFGNLGWAIHLVLPQLQASLALTNNYGAGGNLSRRQAWGDLLLASRDYGRTNRDSWDLSNQGLIANTSIYWANRGLLDLTNANAFAETNGQRYLREAIGLEPWLGSDLPGGGHSCLHGTNYLMITSKGLSREWGYVATAYGEMQFYAADFYQWTTNPAFLAQAVKMVRARSCFRRPAMEVSGGNYYQDMEGIALLAWRGADESDSQFATEQAYGDRTGWALGLRVAAATMDPNAIGYAKQMLADNQYFNNLTVNTAFYTSIGNQIDSRDVLNAFADYNTVLNAPDSGVRLPMTAGQPDFAWADEDDGLVAIKHNGERLWLSTYWEAGNGTGVNGLGRFHDSTTNFDRYGVLETSPQASFGGSFYVRPNLVDLPYKTVYLPPDNPTNAYTGERLPLAANGPLATDDQPFCGKAWFWACRYGNYLIGINRSPSQSFQLRTPADFTSATNLINGQNLTGPVLVAPQSTVVLWLDSATNACPPPQAPLSLQAVGAPTPKISLDWSAASGATGYHVKRAVGSGGPYTAIAGVTGTNYTDTNVLLGGAYYYVVSGTNSCGESDCNSMEDLASAGLPPPWQDADLGTTGLAGSASYAGGTFTTTGAGADIGGTADSFNYVCRSLTNDGTITARLATLQPAGTSDKIALVMRESTNSGASSAVMMFDLTTGFHCVRFAVRSATGAFMTYNWDGPYVIGAPLWLKLQRAGGTFTGSYSLDGVNWTPVGTNAFTMNSNLLAGLAVCARTTTAVATSTFDNVTLPGWPALPVTPTGLTATAGDTKVILNWNQATNATGYNVGQATVSGGPYTTIATNTAGLSATNAGLNDGTRYYYVVSGVNVAGESSNSPETSAQPVSRASPQLNFSLAAGQLQLAWPGDHVGWRLEAQTNQTAGGLGTNWNTVCNSTSTNQLGLPLSLPNGSVFFRLVYP